MVAVELTPAALSARTNKGPCIQHIKARVACFRVHVEERASGGGVWKMRISVRGITFLLLVQGSTHSNALSL